MALARPLHAALEEKIHTSWCPEPNHPQGMKYMEPLAPVVAFSRVKSPALSTQVRPTITL